LVSGWRESTMSAARNLARRTLLTRGVLFLTGLVGVGLAGKTALGREPSADVLAMHIRGGNWRATYPDRRRGVLPHIGQRSAVFGELFSDDAEEKVGEFYASSFQFGSPFGVSEVAAGAMEVHHFNLVDGTIIGVGTTADLDGSQSVYAIIGGTGHYEGASGSYRAVQRPVEQGGDGTADFELNVMLRSA
jgi:hypothetical protein